VVEEKEGSIPLRGRGREKIPVVLLALYGSRLGRGGGGGRGGLTGGGKHPVSRRHHSVEGKGLDIREVECLMALREEKKTRRQGGKKAEDSITGATKKELLERKGLARRDGTRGGRLKEGS